MIGFQPVLLLHGLVAGTQRSTCARQRAGRTTSATTPGQVEHQQLWLVMFWPLGNHNLRLYSTKSCRANIWPPSSPLHLFFQVPPCSQACPHSFPQASATSTVLSCSHLKGSHERFNMPSLSQDLAISNSNVQKSEMYFTGNVSRNLQAIRGVPKASETNLMAAGFHLSFLDGNHHKFTCIRFSILWPEAIKSLTLQESEATESKHYGNSWNLLQKVFALLWISFPLIEKKEGYSNLYFSISAFRLCSSIKNNILYFKPSKLMSDKYEQFSHLQKRNFCFRCLLVLAL